MPRPLFIAVPAYKALINAASWCEQSPSIRRERIRPTRRDSHGGRSGECLSRACIACRHCAADPNNHGPSTHQEARGADAPAKGVRVHSTHRGGETRGGPVSREHTTPLSVRAPHPKRFVALSLRSRSCTGTSVLLKTPGAYTRVAPMYMGAVVAASCAASYWGRIIPT